MTIRQGASNARALLATLFFAGCGNDDAGGQLVLEAALRKNPGDAGANHSLGLLLIRRGHIDSALVLLERAARQEPAKKWVSFRVKGVLDGFGSTIPANKKGGRSRPWIICF